MGYIAPQKVDPDYLTMLAEMQKPRKPGVSNWFMSEMARQFSGGPPFAAGAMVGPLLMETMPGLRERLTRGQAAK